MRARLGYVGHAGLVRSTRAERGLFRASSAGPSASSRRVQGHRETVDSQRLTAYSLQPTANSLPDCRFLTDGQERLTADCGGQPSRNTKPRTLKPTPGAGNHESQTPNPKSDSRLAGGGSPDWRLTIS